MGNVRNDTRSMDVVAGIFGHSGPRPVIYSRECFHNASNETGADNGHS
jgi:hypothetical protein